MSENSTTTTTGSVSRRRLFGEAALAAAAIGIAAAPQAAQAVGTVSSLPKPNEKPRLPMKLLSKSNFGDEFVQQVKAISPQITIVSPDRWTQELPTADAVIGKPSAQELATAKNLRWIQVTSGGVDTMLSPEFVASDIMLTNVSGSYAGPIAETAIAFMMALTRGVGFAAYNRKWEGFDVKQLELRGATLGIIGLGGIGREVARRGQALDMQVIAVDAEPMFKERYRMADEVWLVDTHLDELLERSDVLICCAPLTHRTRGMIGAKQIGMMKDGSYIVNVTRGPIMDTEAMLAALRSKKLAGVGLDVTNPEPLPSDHPLWKEPHAIITPHKSGGSAQTGKREQGICLENVRRFASGLPLLNVVDKQKGY